MKCEYCKSDNQNGEYCEKCNAKLPERKTFDQQLRKSDPFFYNGYVCYSITDYTRDAYEVQFWLGVELQERIVVSRVWLKEMVQEYQDPMPLFWDLFLVAHGEKEVLEWQEKNTKYPARFECRRIENPEKEYLLSLDRKQMTELYQK